jgi:chloramphenicol-sensitive protein RarD
LNRSPDISPDSDLAAKRGAAGVGFGIAAYGLWGVIPLYFRLLGGIPAIEILAHRAWWSFVLLAVIVLLWRQGPAVRAALRSRRTALILSASTLLIALNWFTYIYAVSVEQIVQAGLGYFITPLANVLLGMVVLGERLRRLQVLALALAAAGVIVLTVHGGEIPWIALVLASSFSLYGLMRKLAAAEALVGLFVETLFLSPLALVYLIYLTMHHTGAFAGDAVSSGASNRQWVLMASGPVTTLPLVCFAAAARKLRMTTLGFLQFLTPTMQICLAVFVFGEPFTETHFWGFPLIWIAVALYLADAMRAARV